MSLSVALRMVLEAERVQAWASSRQDNEREKTNHQGKDLSRMEHGRDPTDGHPPGHGHEGEVDGGSNSISSINASIPCVVLQPSTRHKGWKHEEREAALDEHVLVMVSLKSSGPLPDQRL